MGRKTFGEVIKNFGRLKKFTLTIKNWRCHQEFWKTGEFVFNKTEEQDPICKQTQKQRNWMEVDLHQQESIWEFFLVAINI